MSANLDLFGRLSSLVATLTAAFVARPLTPEQTAMLRQDMPQDAVKNRKVGGNAVSYVDGWYVIDRLNTVFGFDGWSIDYGTLELTQVGQQTVVRVPGTLRAGATRKSDIGVAITAGNSPEAFETALKAAYTDALKRCARMLGASLGLALYDKDQRTVGFSLSCQTLLSSLEASADVNAWAQQHGGEISALIDFEKSEVRAAWRRRQVALVPPAQPAAEREITDAHDAMKATLRAAGQETTAAEPLRAPRLAPPTTHPPGGKARAALLAATTVQAFEAALKANAPIIAQLPEETRAEFRELVKDRRAELAVAEITEAAGRVNTTAEAKAVFAKLESLGGTGRITQETADSITEMLNERLAMVAA